MIWRKIGNIIHDYIYLNGDPAAMTKGGQRYYLAYDQVGSLKAVADTAGNVVKKVEYDTFGNILSDTNLTFAVPFGFAGGLHDRDTGLVRFGYRDYDPDMGRWTAKDLIGFAAGDTDLFGYCLGDPVNLVDPLGLETSPCDGSVIYIKAGIIFDPDGIPIGEIGIRPTEVMLKIAATVTGAKILLTAKEIVDGIEKAKEISKKQHNIKFPDGRRMDLKGRHPKSKGHYNKKTKKHYGYPHVHDKKARHLVE